MMTSNPNLAEDGPFSNLRYSRALETAGSNTVQIKSALVQKFGLKTVQGLIDTGRLVIVQTAGELRSKLDGPALLSQKNKITGFLVPDSEACVVNEFGLLGRFKKLSFNEEKLENIGVIVRKGFHDFFNEHRGKGGIHLTSSLLLYPSRDEFKEEINKTESSLKTVRQTLEESDFAYRLPGIKPTYYFFAGRNRNRVAVANLFHSELLNEDLLEIITEFPIHSKRDLDRKAGSDCIRVSGAWLSPDFDASVSSNSWPQPAEKIHTEFDPENTHETLYTQVDYTAESKNKLSRLRKSVQESIQGCYDVKSHTAFLIAENLSPTIAPAALLHEVGIHMAFDSELRSKIYPLVLAAPSVLDKAFSNKEPAAVLAKTSVLANGINSASPNYCEETCGYLVEACAVLETSESKVTNFYKDVISTTNVWMINHGFRSCKKLSSHDLLVAAKANVEALSKLPREKTLSSEGKKILAEHVKNLSTRYSSLKEAKGEIQSLLNYFSDLEKNGKPLPKVQGSVHLNVRDSVSSQAKNEKERELVR